MSIASVQRSLNASALASGDPLPDAVILWTRVSTDGGGPIDAEWEVAEDPAMTKRVANGVAKTDDARDFCVKVDVRGLQPGKTYYYRFRALGGTSKVGRARTAPSGAVSRLRLALVACASYAHGYFDGYRAIAGMLDLDAVSHLGDYIYEYADGAPRQSPAPRPPLPPDAQETASPGTGWSPLKASVAPACQGYRRSRSGHTH